MPYNTPEKRKAWRERNRKKLRANQQRWCKEHQGRNAESQRIWRAEHPELHNARNKLRECRKIRATPLWADTKDIEQIYIRARESGMTVDHIVPLTSHLVCGLHVPYNLQLLPLADNIRKKNRHWPDMPGI